MIANRAVSATLALIFPSASIRSTSATANARARSSANLNARLCANVSPSRTSLGIRLVSLLIGASLAFMFLGAGQASAQTPTVTLPSGVTYEQALQAVANGTATPAETTAYLLGQADLLTSAGVSTSTAMATVEGQMTAQQLGQVCQYYSTEPCNWEEVNGEIVGDVEPVAEGLAEGSTEAADTTSEALSVDTGESIITDTAPELAGTCVETAGFTCGVLGGLAIGTGIYYVAQDLFGDSSPGPVGGGYDDDYTVTGPFTRGFVHFVNSSNQNIACPTSGVALVEPIAQSGAYASTTLYSSGSSVDMGYAVTGTQIMVGCQPGQTGVYVLVAPFSGQDQYTGGKSGGTGAGYMQSWYWEPPNEKCTDSYGEPGDNGPAMAGSPETLPSGYPSGYTLLQRQSTSSTAVAMVEHGWTLFVTSTSLNGCNVYTGIDLEPGSAQKLSSPQTSCPVGANCVSVPDNPTSSWNVTPSQLATELNLYPDLNTYFTSQFGGTSSSGGTVNPPGTVTVPNCYGDTYAACQTLLSNVGLTSTELVVSGAAQVKAAGAGNAIATVPAAGHATSGGSSVQVEVNPSPLWVTLPTPSTGETGTAYETQLEQLGFSSSALSLVVVSDANESPTAGPNGVVQLYDTTTGSSPTYGTTVVNPTDDIQIEDNPTDAPAAVGLPSTSGACSLTPPSASINFGPVTSLNLGSVFPFSVIPWLSSLVGTAPTGQRPDLTFTVFGTQIDATQPLGSTFDPVFSLIRSVVAVLLWIGAMLLLYRRITGSF